MSTGTPTLPQNWQIYSQNKSLLFQFILAEFIPTYREVRKIEQLYHEIASLLSSNQPIKETDAGLSSLMSSIGKLTGNGHLNEYAFPWTTDKGCLSKLKHYCTVYSRLAPSDSSTESAHLLTSANKAFHSALEAREIIIVSQQQHAELRDLFNPQALCRLLDRLIDNIRRFSRLLPSLMLHFREDENVLLCLLRYREELESIYQNGFILKTLRKMHPKGITTVGDLLIKRYTARGFNSLLGLIASKIAEAEASGS